MNRGSDGELSTSGRFIAAAGASVVSAVVVNPFDVVKVSNVKLLGQSSVQVLAQILRFISSCTLRTAGHLFASCCPAASLYKNEICAASSNCGRTSACYRCRGINILLLSLQTRLQAQAAQQNGQTASHTRGLVTLLYTDCRAADSAISFPEASLSVMIILAVVYAGWQQNARPVVQRRRSGILPIVAGSAPQ